MLICINWWRNFKTGLLIYKLLCLGFLGLTLIGFSCTATRVVKPLEKKEAQVGFDYGGPYVNDGMVPLMSVHGAYGVSNRLSAFGGLHVTTLAFQALQLDIGASYGVSKQDGLIPGVSFNGVLNPVISLRDGQSRIYPEFTPNAYWELGRTQLVHLGFTNWFDLYSSQNDIEKGTLMHPSLNLGYRASIRRFVLAAEFKWLSFNQELKIPQATINTLNGKGGYGVYFSASYRFTPKNNGDE